ncbi:quinol:electron acceptor oxidoreductase subunit ActD [Achromobacter aloeverae]
MPDTYASITDRISDIVLARGRARGTGFRAGWRAHWRWRTLFLLTSAATLILFGASAWLFYEGVGLWGVNIPVAWGFALANFVWWIGIGHAGTFISAVLLLLRQKWRTSINRFAEAMTLFAAGIAGLFPILHLGRPWFAYWLMPYPNRMDLWPQWRSPLVWDIFAISTYLLVSLMFWYVGLLPDLATLRDRAKRRARRIVYGLFALGWRGEARHWARYETAYLLLAGLATPLVVSVHTVVSLDFAIGNTPGYHSTIFPPYFVAGALYSGFAMVLTLAIPLRHVFRLQDLITIRHLSLAARVLLATGAIVAYGYASEVFMAFYGGDEFEIAMVRDRWFGAYAPVYWAVLLCNVLIPQVLWSRRVRTSPVWLLAVSLVINLGMWMERFMIVVQSTHRDFLPSSWGIFHPTIWDWTFLLASIGFFAWLFLLFLRFVPMISMSEVREMAYEEEGEAAADDGGISAGDASLAKVPATGLPSCLYGLIAEFRTPEALLDAARQARAGGGFTLEAYAPFPVPGLPEAVGYGENRSVPRATLVGGILGGVLGYVMQWYSATLDYPINVGGRPLHSWPLFIPIAFEMTILCAAVCAVLGMLWANGLPRLNHPLFDAPDFDLASRDRFFLCLRLPEKAVQGDRACQAARAVLEGQKALAIREVPL